MSHPRFALTIVLILLLHTVTPAQQTAIALDKNDPELRAILTEIEADAEKARLKAKVPGMSIVIVYDQAVHAANLSTKILSAVSAGQFFPGRAARKNDAGILKCHIY